MSVITCPACYEHHPTKVTYDPASSRSWIFCAEAGRVWVDDADLATMHLNTSWLPHQLSRALNVAARPPRLTLIENAAWLLGDTVVGSTKVSVALAIGIKGASEIDQMIAGLGRRKVLDIGLLLAARCHLAHYVGAASRYSIIALDELAAFENGSIRVEQARLGAWIRGLTRGQQHLLRAMGGRQPIGGDVLQVFRDRRMRGELYASKNAEATAILGEWQTFFPDKEMPGRSTIRKHLPEPKLGVRSHE